MSIMTATVRDTPGLTIAPTQNTAPVHEFRCMFSHDVRKKQKKWHDGSLRFHTFNKRVMVYDDGKNFIGDLHYRGDEEFGEGTELQLDKGVLVQVEDRIGQTETDLSSLLDRRRSEDDSNNRGVPLARSTLPRIGTLNAQARPKSLAAVLGPSQGPTGRARLPNRSPFEQRQSIAAATLPDEPIPKRRRLSGEKENLVETRPLQLDDGPAVRKAVSKKPPSLKAKPSVARQEPKVRDAVQISCDNETPSTPTSPARPGLTAPSKKKKKTTERKKSSEVSTAENLPQPREKVGKESAASLPSARSSITLANANALGPRERPSLQGKAPLLLAPGLPRKKLIYRALIPGSDTAPSQQRPSSRQKKQPSVASRENIQNSIDSEVDERRPDSQPDVFDVDNRDELDSEAGNSLSALNPVTSTPVRSPTKSIDRSFSPLFMSPFSPDKRTTVRGTASQDILANISPTGQSMTAFDSAERAVLVSEARTSPVGAVALQTRAAGPANPSSLAQIDRRLLMPPPAPAVLSERLQESPQPRPFRRVLARNDSFDKQEAGGQPRSMIPSALESLRAKRTTAAPNKQQAFKSPKRLQRSASNASGLVLAPAAMRAAEESPADATKEDGGPWTEREAYLLFDWWPPGKSKPMYAGEQNTDRAVRGRFVDEVHVR